MGFPKRTGASALVLAVLVSGCSTAIQSKKIDYKSAGQVKSLEVPPDLTVPSRDDRYAVPDVGASKGVATYSAYTSERSVAKTDGAQEVIPAEAGVRMERAGSQRWLVVKGTPDALWPVLREFWQDLGFILNVDQPAIGVMETDWAEDRAKIPQDFIRSTLGNIIDGLYSTPFRDKFRTRIEQGKEPDTVEIYISHRGMEEIYPNEAKDTTIWQPRPADPELEAEMLRRLMVRLGVSEAKAKVGAAQTPQVDRAQLEKTADMTSLQVKDNFDRAWRRVGLALDRLGFTVEDRNRSEGIYYVRYVDPDKGNDPKDGFFSSLAFWRAKKKPIEDGNQYRILVQQQGDASVVKVLRKEGGEDQSETARRILSLLYDQLK